MLAITFEPYDVLPSLYKHLVDETPKLSWPPICIISRCCIRCIILMNEACRPSRVQALWHHVLTVSQPWMVYCSAHLLSTACLTFLPLVNSTLSALTIQVRNRGQMPCTEEEWSFRLLSFLWALVLRVKVNHLKVEGIHFLLQHVKTSVLTCAIEGQIERGHHHKIVVPHCIACS